MNVDDRYPRIAEADLIRYTAAILAQRDTPEDYARITAEVLVASDVRGIESHGVARLEQYVAAIDAGILDPRAAPEIVRQSAATALVDAHNGLGQVVGVAAMRLAIQKALSADVGVVSVQHSFHYGIAGYYAMMALEHNLIGMSLTNSSPLVAPTGSRAALLGTNPIAFAAPTGGPLPFVLDMATSTVPRGRIEVAARKGIPLSAGWAMDAEGRPTLDAQAAMGGALLPLGGALESSGYKGYGLAAMVDILTGVLSGSLYGPLIARLWEVERPSDLGQFFMALNPAAFGPLEQFQRRLQHLQQLLAEAPLAAGATEVLQAGEKEARATAYNRREGVPIHPKVVARLEELGAPAGLGPLPVR
ncbi:MAG TPA: Ldh family oxidoreductase [Chloroflexota bacterium]|nr:Ldh family oxidoreductase [Chloroflexota bacterium]